MGLKVKICGITNLEDAVLALSFGVDSLGFVFYKRSKRYIPPSGAAVIITEIHRYSLMPHKEFDRSAEPQGFFAAYTASVPCTGVFVNEDIQKLHSIVERTGIDIVQLSGNEDMDYINKLDRSVIKKIVKAVRIGSRKDVETVRVFEDQGIGILLDAYLAKHIYGGSGLAFDWSIIEDIDVSDKLLAGGIGQDNIKYIRDNIKPYGVDLSSKVESEPGKKDYDKMRKFFETLNNS